jgi:hypothetical protein
VTVPVLAEACGGGVAGFASWSEPEFHAYTFACSNTLNRGGQETINGERSGLTWKFAWFAEWNKRNLEAQGHGRRKYKSSALNTSHGCTISNLEIYLNIPSQFSKYLFHI